MDRPIRAFYHLPALPQVARIAPSRVLSWLRLGWEDLRRCAAPSIGQGLLFVLGGWLVLLFFSAHIDLLAAATSGFLLLGPLFCAGFYELSRLRAAGQEATFDASLEGALRSGRRLAYLGLLLALLALTWVALSGLLFEQAFGGMLPTVHDNFYRTVLDWNYGLFFATYIATGAVFALIAFALAAVAAPMIFDGAADTTTAVLTSLKAMGANPAAMLLWAASIALLTAIGFATFLLGLALIVPWLGHATWHAYRDLVPGARRSA